MSGRYVGAVFERSQHVSGELLVLLCIAEAINDRSGVAWPSVDRIAKRCKVGVRWVRRVIKSLRESGELDVQVGAGPGGTNLYRISLPITSDDQRVPEPEGSTDPWPVGQRKDGLEKRRGVAGRPSKPEANRNSTVPEAHVDKKTEAQGIARALKAGGVVNARATSDLVDAVKMGATLLAIRAEIDASSGTGDPFAYGVKVVLNRLRSSAALGSEVATADWGDAPRSVVEARGVDTGIGLWDPRAEHWPIYKARVTAAALKKAAA